MSRRRSLSNESRRDAPDLRENEENARATRSHISRAISPPPGGSRRHEGGEGHVFKRPRPEAAAAEQIYENAPPGPTSATRDGSRRSARGEEDAATPVSSTTEPANRPPAVEIVAIDCRAEDNVAPALSPPRRAQPKSVIQVAPFAAAAAASAPSCSTATRGTTEPRGGSPATWTARDNSPKRPRDSPRRGGSQRSPPGTAHRRAAVFGALQHTMPSRNAGTRELIGLCNSKFMRCSSGQLTKLGIIAKLTGDDLIQDGKNEGEVIGKCQRQFAEFCFKDLMNGLRKIQQILTFLDGGRPARWVEQVTADHLRNRHQLDREFKIDMEQIEVDWVVPAENFHEGHNTVLGKSALPLRDLAHCWGEVRPIIDEDAPAGKTREAMIFIEARVRFQTPFGMPKELRMIFEMSQIHIGRWWRRMCEQGGAAHRCWVGLRVWEELPSQDGQAWKPQWPNSAQEIVDAFTRQGHRCPGLHWGGSPPDNPPPSMADGQLAHGSQDVASPVARMGPPSTDPLGLNPSNTGSGQQWPPSVKRSIWSGGSVQQVTNLNERQRVLPVIDLTQPATARPALDGQPLRPALAPLTSAPPINIETVVQYPRSEWPSPAPRGPAGPASQTTGLADIDNSFENSGLDDGAIDARRYFKIQIDQARMYRHFVQETSAEASEAKYRDYQKEALYMDRINSRQVATIPSQSLNWKRMNAAYWYLIEASLACKPARIIIERRDEGEALAHQMHSFYDLGLYLLNYPDIEMRRSAEHFFWNSHFQGQDGGTPGRIVEAPQYGE